MSETSRSMHENVTNKPHSDIIVINLGPRTRYPQIYYTFVTKVTKLATMGQPTFNTH
jgi:hypothetical protein